jgi:hypothetical protein
MKSDAPARGLLEIGDLPALKEIRAIDLTSRLGDRALWKSSLRGEPATPAPDLPRPGFALPMGFWLSETGEAAASGPVPSRYTIRFGSDSAADAPAADARAAGAVRGRRPEQTVRLKPPHVGEGELVLKIGPAGVRIITTGAVWKALSGPVLLAVGVYWRFLAIEDELHRLTERAKADLDHATMPGASSWKVQRRLVADARAVRDLLLDLPHFEGPITDPFPYCSTELSAQTFNALAEKLHFEPWCELIDERAEAVEDTYEAVTEKLLEFRHFVYEAILELLIVVILLGELGLALWEQFSP